MMNKTLSISALVFAAACGDTPLAEQSAATSSTPVFEPFPSPGFLCSPRRTVVLDPTGACAPHPGWLNEPVFVGAAGPALQAYCLYRWLGVADPTPADVSSIPGAERHSDCLVAHPVATSTAWDEMHSAFQKQIDLPRVQYATGAPPSQTWVAMIDTSVADPSSDGAATSGLNDHGYVLGRIIREAGCPDPSGATAPCTVYLHSELAFPWRFDGTRWIESSGAGGHFGYQSDVARAIFRALHAWSLAPTTSRLVVNLSLGWLPFYGGANPTDPIDRSSARSVYDVIQLARCQNALIVAAAGNASGGLSHTGGPLLPAAWSTHRAPSTARCNQLGGSVAGYSENGGLLEAIGGVDGKDHPVSNARPDSTPRLVAPSARGTATAPGKVNNTVLTGTSVGTAVAAAAAAIAWAYAPERSVSAMTEALYLGGTSLNITTSPDLCKDSLCPNVHRISICGTLEHVCTSPSGALLPRCTPQTCTHRPAYTDMQPQITAAMLPTPDEIILASGMNVWGGGSIPSECGPTNGAFRPAGRSGPIMHPCPERQAYNGAAHPSVTPQPSGIGCHVCMRFLRALEMDAYIQLEAPVAGTKLYNPSIQVETTTGSYRYTVYELSGRRSLSTGKSYKFTEIPLPSGTLKAAKLHGVDARGQSWSAAIHPGI